MPKDDADQAEMDRLTARHGTDWLQQAPAGGLGPIADAEEPQGLVLTIGEADMERLQLLLDDMAAPLAAYVAVQVNERDAYREQLTQARALANRLTKALAYLVKEWPQTSWAGSNDAHDTAQALLDELAGEPATMGSPDPATVQENTPDATPHQDPADD